MQNFACINSLLLVCSLALSIEATIRAYTRPEGLRRISSQLKNTTSDTVTILNHTCLGGSLSQTNDFTSLRFVSAYIGELDLILYSNKFSVLRKFNTNNTIFGVSVQSQRVSFVTGCKIYDVLISLIPKDRLGMTCTPTVVENRVLAFEDQCSYDGSILGTPMTLHHISDYDFSPTNFTSIFTVCEDRDCSKRIMAINNNKPNYPLHVVALSGFIPS